MNESHGSEPADARHPARAESTIPPRQLDRAAGALLGAACGDALGVPYEFARRLSADEMPAMTGGGLGPYAPGEYSDDTQMAACIAQVAATGADLRGEDALDAIAASFLDWAAAGASDIGAQTSAVRQPHDTIGRYGQLRRCVPPRRRCMRGLAGLRGTGH